MMNNRDGMQIFMAGMVFCGITLAAILFVGLIFVVLAEAF